MTITSVKVKQKRKAVINVPRYTACEAQSGMNVISIEYHDNERPVFAEGVNVFKITCLADPVGCGGQELIDWIQSCNGENIIVHCEMGISRSKALATWLANNFGYTYIGGRWSPFKSVSIADCFNLLNWGF